MATRMNNQRKYARAIYCTEADLDTTHGQIKCFTVNLTPEGMLVRSEDPLLLGEEVTVSFALPHGEMPVQVCGKVVRLMGDRAGLKFNRTMDGILYA